MQLVKLRPSILQDISATSNQTLYSHLFGRIIQVGGLDSPRNASFRELSCRLGHHKKKGHLQCGSIRFVPPSRKKKRFRVLRESAIVSARRFVILVGSWQYHHQIMTTSSSCHVTSMQFCWVGLMEGDFALQALIEWEVLICTCKPILQSFLHNLNGMCFDCLCGGEDKKIYRNEVECGVGWGSCR